MLIGERFYRFTKPVPPRQMSRVNNFINFLHRKALQSTQRASYFTPNGYGSRLFVDIIKLCGLHNFLGQDLTSKMILDLHAMVKDLEKPIDVRIGKHTTSQLFIKSKTPCFELMTSSRLPNPLNDIPFDLPYNHPKWQDTKPFRIIDMGTTDLKFQVYEDYLTYLHHGPTHCVYSLDCLVLVTKFLAYYQWQKETTNLDQCLLNFVHNDIIVPSLLEDSIAIWLRNIYRQQFLSASPLESHTSTIWDVVNMDTIGSDFTGAMVDVQHLKNDLKNQSVSSQTVMSSLIVDIDGTSLTDYFRHVYATSTTPYEQPYIWVDCLKWMNWWEAILMYASFTPDFPDTISFQRDVIRDIRFWLMVKPWQNIHGSIPYRTMVRSKLEGMYTFLQQQG